MQCGMNRPSSAPIRKQVNLPADVAQQVDEYRFANRFKSESEAIRQLIEMGLEAAGKSAAESQRDEKLGFEPGVYAERRSGKK